MFKVNLDLLLILDTIDRLGSFVAAANALNKVPSTISYSISKLEQDLGIQIFERTGPKVKLTIVGKELLKEGRFLLRAAEDLEHRVRRVALGWETELTIGMDSLFSPVGLSDHIADFYSIAGYTRLRFFHETLSGTWEALLDKRVDLLIGAAGEGPSGGGYHTFSMGSIPFVFVVAPTHPLATINKPLGKADLRPYRAVVVGDSVRGHSSRTVGVLWGQDTLTVPDMQTKVEFQLAGLGFGFLPWPLAREAISKGLLIEKVVTEPRAPEPVYLAWRIEEEGQALNWWIHRIKSNCVIDQLWRSGLNVPFNGMG